MDPGTAIRCETSKWGDRPHWQFDGFFLGSDEHGDWIGVPQGTHHHRPGLEFHSDDEHEQQHADLTKQLQDRQRGGRKQEPARGWRPPIRAATDRAARRRQSRR